MPENPYLPLSMLELADACMKAASAVEPGKQRSEDGRRPLDDKLKLLLIAASHRLNPPFFRSFTHDDGSMPAMRDAGLAWVHKSTRDARYLVLTHAADRALGPKGAA